MQGEMGYHLTKSHILLSLFLLNQTWLVFDTTHFVPPRRPLSWGLPEQHMLAPLLAVGWRSTECLVSSWCEEHTKHPDGQVSPPTPLKQVFAQLSPTSILWGKEAINSAGHWETQASPMLLQCRGRGVRNSCFCSWWAQVQHFWAVEVWLQEGVAYLVYLPPHQPVLQMPPDSVS